MKVFKRNIVIVTVLLFVCAAVYLNWSYNNRDKGADTVSADVEGASEAAADGENASSDVKESSEESGLYYSEESDSASVNAAAANEYFAEVRLERQQARDEAAETLQVVSEAEGASQEVIDDALSKMSSMAEYTVLESKLESQIKAKGYADCVVYISGDDVAVTILSEKEELTTSSVAQITDIITSNTDFTAENIKINEVK